MAEAYITVIQTFNNNSSLLTDGYDLFYQNNTQYTNITNNLSGNTYDIFTVKNVPDDIMYLKIKNGNIYFNTLSGTTTITNPITNFTYINKKEQYSFDYILQDVNNKYNLNNSSMYIFKSDRFALISNGASLKAINPIGDTYTIV